MSNNQKKAGYGYLGKGGGTYQGYLGGPNGNGQVSLNLDVILRKKGIHYPSASGCTNAVDDLDHHPKRLFSPSGQNTNLNK